MIPYSKLRQNVELLYLLVLKELKVRYKSSFLGYVWALLNPFAFALVYWIAFKFIMRVQMENYSVFLLTGMFPWLWFSNGVVQATRSFQNNSSLIKKVKLSKAILPLSNVSHEMVHFCFALPIIIAFLLFTREEFHLSWLWQIPVMAVVQILFSYPLALIFAIANAFVHDVEYLVGIALSMLFFVTPMVYPISMVPPEFRTYFEINPLHALIQSWRSVFLQGTIDGTHFAYCFAFGAVLMVIALVTYRRFGWKIGELL